MNLTDREVFLKSTDAYVSYLRAYKEHHCSYIFRLEKLDFAGLARGMGLIRLPKISELRDKKVEFEEAQVDFDAIPYNDAIKEKQRQEKMVRERAAVDLKMKQMKERKKREHIDDEQGGKAKKKFEIKVKVGGSNWSKDELDELANDARLLKKLKKGKITQEEYDRQTGDEALDKDFETAAKIASRTGKSCFSQTRKKRGGKRR